MGAITWGPLSRRKRKWSAAPSFICPTLICSGGPPPAVCPRWGQVISGGLRGQAQQSLSTARLSEVMQGPWVLFSLSAVNPGPQVHCPHSWSMGVWLLL